MRGGSPTRRSTTVDARSARAPPDDWVAGRARSRRACTDSGGRSLAASSWSALAVAFAASTAVFNATYRHQADVDAVLTNGADVTVTEPPGALVGPASAAACRGPRGGGVEPLQHRFAYVGADLQDLYGLEPRHRWWPRALQNAYFQGGTAAAADGALAARPDNVLVSAETVHDYQLSPGDPITLRLQDARTGRYEPVPFHYVGVAKEFPTAPKDSFSWPT